MSDDKAEAKKVNVKSEDEATPTAPAVDEAKTETKPSDPAGNSADNTQVPGRDESLKSAGTASPASEDGGLEDGTTVLGQEGQSHEDRLDEARRDALNNAKDEQKLNA